VYIARRKDKREGEERWEYPSYSFKIKKTTRKMKRKEEGGEEGSIRIVHLSFLSGKKVKRGGQREFD